MGNIIYKSVPFLFPFCSLYWPFCSLKLPFCSLKFGIYNKKLIDLLPICLVVEFEFEFIIYYGAKFSVIIKMIISNICSCFIAYLSYTNICLFKHLFVSCCLFIILLLSSCFYHFVFIIPFLTLWFYRFLIVKEHYNYIIIIIISFLAIFSPI